MQKKAKQKQKNSHGYNIFRIFDILRNIKIKPDY